MDDTCAPENVSVIRYQRKRKRQQKVKDLESECDVLDTIGLNSLPDDVLIAILSRMSLVEAVRNSVLSRRWRHLWRFTSGSLDFVDYKINTGDTGKAITWVNRVIKLHQGPRLDSFIVRFYNGGVYDDTIPRWIYFAMKKEVKKFELKLGYTERWACHYDFPNLKKLLSLNCSFGSLTSPKLWFVNIPDEVVHYLLASCPYLESLSITLSSLTRNLEIVDPIPNLKTLEISSCSSLESLKVSAASIVSFSFGGLHGDNNLFGNIPNLRELTLIGDSATSFIYEYEDNKLASYSVQLMKLALHLYARKYMWAVPHNLPMLYSLKRLELSTECRVGQSLLFFTLLIKAAPVLHEFRAEVNYNYYRFKERSLMPFPHISETEAPTFHHENLKLVELIGYIGCPSEGEFLLHLFKVAPSLEKVVIGLNSMHFYQNWSEHFYEELKDCYHNNLQIQALTMKEADDRRIKAQMKKEAKERTKHLQSVLSPKAQLVIR